MGLFNNFNWRYIMGINTDLKKRLLETFESMTDEPLPTDKQVVAVFTKYGEDTIRYMLDKMDDDDCEGYQIWLEEVGCDLMGK
jgi:hypothetical protein